MKPQNTKKNHTLSQVRIIGGEYRRRQIQFIDADGLRPTPDRLRETLFNWLQNELPNATVLDCCAGSGVLGFEAISRGAKNAILIEPNSAQYRQLLTTSEILQIPAHKITVKNAPAQTVLTGLNETFDVIFLDPPYSLNLWQELLALIKQHQLVHADSLIYIEANQPLDMLLKEIEWIEPYKSGKFGQIYAGLYRIVTTV